MAALSEEYVHAVLERELGGPRWEVSDVRGSMGATRLASRGDVSVAVKLPETPPELITRLSEIGVTAPVLATGEHEGRRYLVQQVVTGPRPDHDWFAANVPAWSDLVRRYLDDEPLRRMLAAEQGFWRLDVAGAVAMIDGQPAPTTVALREPEFGASLERWRSQAGNIVGLPMRPIHPDPHWFNYVIADGRPYLLDWDYVDLSDPVRDVGIQVWGFLPRRLWPEFLRGVGLTLSEELEAAVFWWAAFKVVLNAFFNDGRGDESFARFHTELFRIAVQRKPWVEPG